MFPFFNAPLSFSQVKYWFQRQRRNNKKRRQTASGSDDHRHSSPKPGFYAASSSKSPKSASASAGDSTSEYDIDEADIDGVDVGVEEDEEEGSRPLKIDLDALPEFEETNDVVDQSPSSASALTVDVRSPTRIRIKSPSALPARFQRHPQKTAGEQWHRGTAPLRRLLVETMGHHRRPRF